MQITFIRHAETAGNTRHVWQGHSDSPLSETGRRQAADLGRRPQVRGFDLVVGSDLGRVVATVRSAGLDHEPDPVWREVDVGAWEGLTRDEVAEQFPEELEALQRGEEVRIGGAETWKEFGERVDSAVADLVGRCDPGDRVAVFTHGGVIHSLVAGHLGLRARRRPLPFDRLGNTSLTTFRIGEAVSLETFNDASHTRVARHPNETGLVVALIRHGEAVANVVGRWQGITDGPLSDLGREQAAGLAARYDGLSHVYTSHLSRARETAAALAGASGVGVIVRGDLHEIDFGEWEDRTPEEVRERFPADWKAVHEDHVDIPRGRTGETAAEVALRMAGAVESIAAAHSEGRVAAVGHGGAIRAYAAEVVGLGFADRGRLAIPGNTGVTHIRIPGNGPVLSSHNMRVGE
jgi:probable phosphoglycerate mutase